MTQKKAFFRFEASVEMGAGHGMRSIVLADKLAERGWKCQIVTSEATYIFLKKLSKFDRIDPAKFYEKLQHCDLLVVDHYGLAEDYESHFRPVATKILVIDDLANRRHNCDILLDQTYGRTESDYKNLVPQECEILTGSDYVLLRKEFTQLRPQAIEKRRQTKEVKRILVSMGGSDPNNYTLKALSMIKESGFMGAIDIVLGFSAPHIQKVKDCLRTFKNESKIHVDADMPSLVYEADLAIGAAGSSVWERCCLGLPQILMATADNQKKIMEILYEGEFSNFLKNPSFSEKQRKLCVEIDGLGIFRILNFIEDSLDVCGARISYEKIKFQDIDQIYSWQQEEKIRKFSFNKNPPSYESHKKWFSEQLDSRDVVFEKIICKGKACGALRLDYLAEHDAYLLNWYIIPVFQNRGIGTLALNYAKSLSFGKKIRAFVFDENISSCKSLEKSGFYLKLKQESGLLYEY